MKYSVFDIETDGLLEDATKIHCMSVYKYEDGNISNFTLTDYSEMASFLEKEEVLVGHNIVMFDIPVLEKFLSIKVKSLLVDTLGLSWYLYPERKKHSLEYWGEDLGIAKPAIEDWSELDIRRYIHRCETDVQINTALWHKMTSYLRAIYTDKEKAFRMIGYISFKLQCARDQERLKWKLDVEKCQEYLETLIKEREVKLEILSEVMPPVNVYRIISRPKVLYKKDGSLSSRGIKWMEVLKEEGLPDYHLGAIKRVASTKKGNPKSFTQLKNWLFSLGWQPETFKYERESYDSPEIRKIPQLSLIDGSGICPSVKKLYSIEPNLEHIEGLFILSHRIAILKGFLRDADNEGYLRAQIHGFTNTMRFQHTTIVNLPTIHKPHGEKIRGVLIAPEGYTLCGSDMSSLEDNTKQHYMYFYDPEYVKEMRTPGFDPHLDIAIQGGMLTIEQVQAHKEKREDHSKVRKDAKVVNFSAVYGVGASKMSLTTNWPISKSKQLLEIYWKRNWSVKKIAQNCKVKRVDGQMWLLNPVSQFWYSLRYDKDRFSTLNQGTGVYCFDTWVRRVKSKGLDIIGQFHDEIIVLVPIGKEKEVERLLQEAITETNEELKLNIQLGISVQFGNNYAAIH